MDCFWQIWRIRATSFFNYVFFTWVSVSKTVFHLWNWSIISDKLQLVNLIRFIVGLACIEKVLEAFFRNWRGKLVQFIPLYRFEIDMIFEGLKRIGRVRRTRPKSFLVIQSQQSLNYILGILFHAKRKVWLSFSDLLENLMFKLAMERCQTYTHLINHTP